MVLFTVLYKYVHVCVCVRVFTYVCIQYICIYGLQVVVVRFLSGGMKTCKQETLSTQGQQLEIHHVINYIKLYTFMF